MPSDVNVKLQKIARLARCPSAPKGEAANAAAMVVKIARKNHVDLTGYLDLLVIASRLESKPPGSRPPISKPWNSSPPVVKPWTPPPVERPPFSRQWEDSETPDYTPPYTTPPYTWPSSPKPPRSKPKQSEPETLVAVMPSGLYRGKTIKEIFECDPVYLFWFMKAHLTQKNLRASIQAFLRTEHAANNIPERLQSEYQCAIHK
jgi:uncharacterized protein (DUF3820 family)